MTVSTKSSGHIRQLSMTPKDIAKSGGSLVTSRWSHQTTPLFARGKKSPSDLGKSRSFVVSDAKAREGQDLKRDGYLDRSDFTS